MANDPTNTAPNVSVDGSIGWTGDAVPIQHPLPGQIISPQSAAAAAAPPPPVPATPKEDTSGASIVIDHAVTKLTPAPSAPAASSGGYPVVHGDTLEGIAAAHNMTVEQIKSLNPKLQAQSGVYPGQLLKLAEQAPLATAAAPAAPPAPTIGPLQSSYTMANAHELEAAIHKELNGWVSTVTNPSTDPAKNLIEAAQKPKTDTDPLKVEHNQK